MASSIARSREGRDAQAALLGATLRDLIAGWKEQRRMGAADVLRVAVRRRGPEYKKAAERLGISEQAVANHKYFAVSKLKAAAEASKLRDADLKAFGVD